MSILQHSLLFNSNFLTVILGASMCFVGGEAAYALFPCTTFDQQRSLSIYPGADFAVVDKRCLKLLSWTNVGQASLWESTDPESEWRAGSRYIGDHLCWVHKLTAINPKAITRCKSFFTPRRRKAIQANAWGMAYNKLSHATHSWKTIKYLADSGNYCLTTIRWK
ncbi:hypothetical protein C8J56DRAFT_1053059 [Mycena floridula]|nr:hypothetical protein C8J56DRAFT_1053059 [Mycena floridula]